MLAADTMSLTILTAGMSGCHRLCGTGVCSSAFLLTSTLTSGVGVRGGIAALQGLQGWHCVYR